MAGLGLIKKDKKVDKEELVKLFPKKKNTITDETVDIVNKTIEDPEFNGYSLIQTMVDYQNVMYEASASIGEYINAIRFCAFLESDTDSVVGAYTKTFISRDFVKNRVGLPTDSMGYKELTTAASRYHKSPLVRGILTQADMPMYLLFRGHAYKAIEVLADRAVNSKLDRDKINAAKFLYDAVKPPEDMKIELGIGPNKEAIDLNAQISAQLAETVAMQKRLIDSGVDLREATRLGININDAEEAEVE